MLVPSLQQVVCILQGLCIRANPAERFPVLVFYQGAILVTVHIHDKLQSKDSLLLGAKALYSFIGPKLFWFDVLFFAQYFNNGVPVMGVVELHNNLLHGLELFEVRGEINFMLFWVNEVLVYLPQRFDWLCAPPVVEADVLE